MACLCSVKIYEDLVIALIDGQIDSKYFAFRVQDRDSGTRGDNDNVRKNNLMGTHLRRAFPFSLQAYQTTSSKRILEIISHQSFRLGNITWSGSPALLSLLTHCNEFQRSLQRFVWDTVLLFLYLVA